jgi:hypothetical protein
MINEDEGLFVRLNLQHDVDSPDTKELVVQGYLGLAE